MHMAALFFEYWRCLVAAQHRVPTARLTLQGIGRRNRVRGAGRLQPPISTKNKTNFLRKHAPDPHRSSLFRYLLSCPPPPPPPLNPWNNRKINWTEKLQCPNFYRTPYTDSYSTLALATGTRVSLTTICYIINLANSLQDKGIAGNNVRLGNGLCK